MKEPSKDQEIENTYNEWIIWRQMHFRFAEVTKPFQFQKKTFSNTTIYGKVGDKSSNAFPHNCVFLYVKN